MELTTIESPRERSTNQALGLDMDVVRELSDQAVALIVDDDEDTVTLLKLTLRKSGFNVVGAFNGEEALTKCVDVRPKVILLDLMMPLMDGWETLRQLREITGEPIVVVSALDQDDHVVEALAQGADDYIRKPFSAKEVVARVEAALRRARDQTLENVVVFPQIRMIINLDTHQVAIQDQRVKLTPNEYAVLALMAQYPRKPIPYDRIGKAVWGSYSPKIHKRLKWTVHILRRKLEAFEPSEELIVNHPKFGYQFLT